VRELSSTAAEPGVIIQTLLSLIIHTTLSFLIKAKKPSAHSNSNDLLLHVILTKTGISVPDYVIH
jgi:hypothetical protein